MPKNVSGMPDSRSQGNKNPYNNGSDRRITHSPGGSAVTTYTEPTGPATGCTPSGKPPKGGSHGY